MQPVVVVPMLAPDAGAAAPLASDTPMDVEVKLVSPGEEPRRPLRVALSVGASHPMRVTTRVGVIAKPAKKRLPRPKLEEDTVVCTVEVVALNGKAELALRCPAGDALRAPLATRGAVAVTGLTEGAPKEAFGQARAHALLGLAPIFPAEPVGVGARWEVTVAESAYGLPRKRTTRYVLESLDGGVAKVAWSEGALTAPGRLRPPSPWARGDLVGFELVGEGRVELTLGEAPVATRGQGSRSEWAKIRSFQGPSSVFLDVVTVTSFVLEAP